MCARKFVTVTACSSHVLAHFIHPIQAAENALLATAPLSVELHLTNTVSFFLTMSITLAGQALAQAPHPTQRSLFTVATPFEMQIASYAHSARTDIFIVLIFQKDVKWNEQKFL